MTATQTDIALDKVQCLVRNLENPTHEDIIKEKRIPRYFKGTIEMRSDYLRLSQRQTSISIGEAEVIAASEA